MTVANLHLRLDLLRLSPCHPVDCLGHQAAGHEPVLAADRDAATLRIDVGDVLGRGQAAHPQAAALADREPVDAAVRAEYLPVLIDHLASLQLICRQPLLDKARIVPVGHEANVLTLRLLCHFEPQGTGFFSHCGLGEVANREQRAGELRLA